MNPSSVIVRWWAGLCPLAPVLHSPPVIRTGPETGTGIPPGGRGALEQGRPIRSGIRIATGSIKSLIHDRNFFWFSFPAGIMILALVVANAWIVMRPGYPTGFLVSIPYGESSLVIDSLSFLVEATCISCFMLLLAGLVRYCRLIRESENVIVPGGFSGLCHHAGSLTALSTGMALFATLLSAFLSQDPFFGSISSGISQAIFRIPYVYYIPNEVFSTLYISSRLILIDILLFLGAMYVIPVIVLENKGLLPSLAGSALLVKRTWRELLGCAIVLGAILLAVIAIALLIGQSPLLLNHDYDFFLQVSRGQVLMTIACYGFIVGCGVLMALGSTAFGIAATDLYSLGKEGIVPAVPVRDISSRERSAR